MRLDRLLAAICCLVAVAFGNAAGGETTPQVACAARRHSPHSPEVEATLRRWLGDDYDGAKVVSISGKSVLVTELKSGRSVTLASFDDDKRKVRLERPWFSVNGTHVVFSYDGRCYLARADGSMMFEVLEDEGGGVGEASFWYDWRRGEHCIVYCVLKGSTGRREVWQTWLYRMREKTKTKLADRQFRAGMSPDGTHLADAGGGVWMMNLPARKVTRLFLERSACNGSISPDCTHRMMHLYAPHTHFGIRDEFDRELWSMEMINGRQWSTPRWSNHPNFCLVLGDGGLRLIKIDTKESVVLRGVPGSYAQLWLPSGCRPPAERRGPVDRLKLTRLSDYRRKLARAEIYTPIIAELKELGGTEARLIVAELEKQGQAALDAALAEKDAGISCPELRELALRFRGHPIGNRAQETLDSPSFKKEWEAAKLLHHMKRQVLELQPVEGEESVFSSVGFRRRNRGRLCRLAEMMPRFRGQLAGTHAAAVAEKIAAKLGLPNHTGELGNEKLTIVAFLTKTSHVPTYQEIAPYTSAVTYLRYRIQGVVSGTYDKNEIVVVNWVIKDKKTTPVAEWEPGRKQLLTLDRLEFHPELEEVAVSDDANDLDLAAWWTLLCLDW